MAHHRDGVLAEAWRREIRRESGSFYACFQTETAHLEFIRTLEMNFAARGIHSTPAAREISTSQLKRTDSLAVLPKSVNDTDRQERNKVGDCALLSFLFFSVDRSFFFPPPLSTTTVA